MSGIEDPAYWDTNFKRNSQWLQPGQHSYNTPLSPDEEASFRVWVKSNNVPFDIGKSVTDYDMRGFWKALNAGDPRAKSAVNPNDRMLHYPDYWKTPYNATFSNQSQWANPKTAPMWQGSVYRMPNGPILYNDETQMWVGPNPPWGR